jgi:hypothetical protein
MLNNKKSEKQRNQSFIGLTPGQEIEEKLLAKNV